MKKIVVLITLLFFPSIVLANEIGDFYRDINISVNCSQCDPSEEPEVTFQLFADDEEVEGQKLVLNKENEYKGTFEHLRVFKEGSFKEINYEVKFLEDGEYRSLKPEEITYNKEKVSKWVQVLPEDIQPGHKYALFTDNWNYEANGGPKWVFITNTMGLEAATADSDYKIINGKKSYYSLTTEPNPDWLWTITKVPSTDLLYEGFENYWVLTNVDSKRLSLSGFDKGTWIDYVFRQTGKPDGWSNVDGSWNTTKVEFLPVADEIGRFVISSHNIINDEVRGTKYLGVDHFLGIKVQTEYDYGARVMAFEYLENENVEMAYNIQINMVLCETEETQQEEQEQQENPNTSAKGLILIVVGLTISILLLHLVNKKYIY